MAQNDTATQLKGLGEVLAGCASCCDGVLAQARTAGASQDIVDRLQQASDICRGLAEDLPSA
jgi:hypothetical protein